MNTGEIMAITNKAYKCELCSKEFYSKQAKGGHVSHAHGLASGKKPRNSAVNAAASARTSVSSQLAATPLFEQVTPTSQISKQLVTPSTSSQVATTPSSKQVAPSNPSSVQQVAIPSRVTAYSTTPVFSSTIPPSSHAGDVSDKTLVVCVLGLTVGCGILYLIDRKMRHDQEMKKAKMVLEQEATTSTPTIKPGFAYIS
jgi:hypothetical protein